MNMIGMQLSWITVRDIESAVKFYNEVLGFELCEYNKEFGWAELKGKEGARLGLSKYYSESGFEPGSNAVVTITVENIELAVEDFKKKNIKLVDGIMDIAGQVKLQTFVDADGNTFQLCEVLKNK